MAVDEKALNGFVGRECPAAGFRAAICHRGPVKGKGHGAKPSPPQTAGWAFAPYNHAVSLCMATVSRCAPVGLRAMAATHHLDISLTLDDIGWHFLNWRGKEHAEETIRGLKELELNELARLFRSAERLMRPHLGKISHENYYETLEKTGKMKKIDELTKRAHRILDIPNRNVYFYWVRYTHAHPEKVFPSKGAG